METNFNIMVDMKFAYFYGTSPEGTGPSLAAHFSFPLPISGNTCERNTVIRIARTERELFEEILYSPNTIFDVATISSIIYPIVRSAILDEIDVNGVSEELRAKAMKAIEEKSLMFDIHIDADNPNWPGN